MTFSFSPPTQETDLASGVCISTPGAEPYQAAACLLQSTLEDVLSSSVEILPDNQQAFSGRHVIALGNMMDSAFLRALYFRAYDLTDRAWPSPGGWAIRTVPHSVEDVGQTIVVGVSRAEDVINAAGELAGEIETKGPVLPYLHRVQPGQWSHMYLKPAGELLAQGDHDLEQKSIGGGGGDWVYMAEIAAIGMLALQTGDQDLTTMFCRQICTFVKTRWFHRQLEDPPLIHGRIRILLLPFAMLENNPGLTRAQREEALEGLLALYRSTEGAGNTRLLNEIGVNRVRQNHQTRSALDLYYGGRYFHQVHGLQEGRSWMQLAGEFFEPQMASNKPVCDSWWHQWMSSMFDTADFAMASGRTDYFTSRPFLEGADRALIAYSNLEKVPLQYLLMAAAVTENSAYLQLCRTADEQGLAERAVRQHEDPLRTWMAGHQAVEPGEVGRMGVAPLSRLFYDSIESYEEFTPKGVYLRNVPYEETFDKIFFRSGWTDDDEYLLLDGISGGSHSYQDANCIVRFTSRGKTWFGGSAGMDPASVRDHVGVSVAVNGAGPGFESRYAALRYLREEASASVAGTCISYPDQANWYRHIVHCRAGWFLVIDEFEAQCAGEFLMEGRWQVLGEATLSGGELCSMQGDVRLMMRHVGSDAQELVAFPHTRTTNGMQWNQRCMRNLRPGEGIRIATLFWADWSDRNFELSAEPSGFLVRGDGKEFSVSLDANAKTPEFRAGGVVLPGRAAELGFADSTLFRIHRGGMKPDWEGVCDGPVSAIARLAAGCCVGDEKGGIRAFDSEGEMHWNSRIPGGVRAIAELYDGGVIAGGDEETLHRLDSTGKEIWSHRIVWQPMNWDRWSRMNCTVVSLAAGDIDGDGRQEILVGCADRHLYAFDDEGAQMWRSGCQWGPPVCLALAHLNGKPFMQVLAGMANPAIHGCVRVYDATGECVQTLYRPDVMCWSIPSWSKCIRTVDIDGDGCDEVISGLDTNHRQLIVYQGDGKVMWDADLGGGVSAVETAGGRVYAGATNGYVHCFDAEGNRLWCRFLIAPVIGLAPSRSAGCIVALEDGTVINLDTYGEIEASRRRPGKSTTANCTDDGLVVGREDGTVEFYAHAN